MADFLRSGRGILGRGPSQVIPNRRVERDFLEYDKIIIRKSLSDTMTMSDTMAIYGGKIEGVMRHPLGHLYTVPLFTVQFR